MGTISVTSIYVVSTYYAKLYFWCSKGLYFFQKLCSCSLKFETDLHGKENTLIYKMYSDKLGEFWNLSHIDCTTYFQITAAALQK